jgi:hypothetical protein
LGWPVENTRPQVEQIKVRNAAICDCVWPRLIALSSRRLSRRASFLRGSTGPSLRLIGVFWTDLTAVRLLLPAADSESKSEPRRAKPMRQGERFPVTFVPARAFCRAAANVMEGVGRAMAGNITASQVWVSALMETAVEGAANTAGSN